MKNIKNVNGNSGKDIKPSTIPTIEGMQPLKSKRQRVQVCCAFHPFQIITNFCKNVTCLLPLCPKCVKIHIQQHAQSGKLANFQAIQDCLDQVHNCLSNSLSNINRLQKLSTDIQQKYRNKKDQIMNKFQKIKNQSYQYLQQIFNSYKLIIIQQIKKDDSVFVQDFSAYHNSIGFIMESCRIISHKFNHKNTIMEGLIGFYSKYDLLSQYKQCQQKLNDIKFSTIVLSANDKQLQKFQPIIHKYIRIGNCTSSPQQSTTKYPNNQKISQDITPIKQSPPPTALRTESITQRQFPPSYNFQHFKTPLDQFSLQKSRNTRISLKKNKNLQLP